MHSLDIVLYFGGDISVKGGRRHRKCLPELLVHLATDYYGLLKQLEHLVRLSN